MKGFTQNEVLVLRACRCAKMTQKRDICRWPQKEGGGAGTTPLVSWLSGKERLGSSALRVGFDI